MYNFVQAEYPNARNNFNDNNYCFVYFSYWNIHLFWIQLTNVSLVDVYATMFKPQ